MTRPSRTSSDEGMLGAARVGMLLEQIEMRYDSDLYAANMASAFVLYLIKKAELVDVDDLSDFLRTHLQDRQLSNWIKSQIGDHWNDFRRLIALVQTDWLREYILTRQPQNYRESDIATADCICDLAIEIMKEGESRLVCDPTCGAGTFLTRLAANNVLNALTCYDISERCLCITKLRSLVLERNDIEIVRMNGLEAEIGILGNFDFIFLNPPFGLRLTNIHTFFNNQERAVPPAFPMVKSTNSTEWIWAAKCLESLNPGGRLAMLVSNGALFNMTEAPLRQFLVDRGYVECVIALPEKLLTYTGVSISMVVLSKNENSAIKMIDATGLFARGARINVMQPLHISAVIDALKDDQTKIRRDVSINEIAQNNYQLSVQRYFTQKIEVPNGKPLGELCTKITRGAALTREELHEKKMDVTTDTMCLTVGDVQDGIISDNLQFLSGITVNLNKYLVESGDVVLSKAIVPCKVAVMEVPEGNRVLTTANFFILKLDRKQLDPYYLAAYLRSEEGRLQIEQAATGTVIRTLGQENLEKMMIPIVTMERQKKIAMAYRRKLDELRQKRKECDTLKMDLDNLFNSFDKEEQE